MANYELTAEIVRQIIKEEVGGLSEEMHQGFEAVNARFETMEQNTIDGFQRVISTIDQHMSDTDTKFTSDRKRIERLEKIVLY